MSYAEQPEIQKQQCPDCHAVIPVYRGYVAWCDQCGWNLQPLEPEASGDVFKKAYASVGTRMGQRLFEELLNAKSLRPKWTLSKLLAFGIAITVHGFTLVLVIGGVWLLIAAWPNLCASFLAFLFLLVAWFLRPRFPQVPTDAASRSEFPALYSFCDDVSHSLGATNVHIIVIDGHFNASFTRVGWRRKKVLYLGLPLFSILDRQEKVALIAHELAHDVNGDPSRGLLIGTAISTLIGWYELLYPDFSGPRLLGIEGLLLIPVNLMRWSLASLARLGAIILAHLLYRDSQRAEYLADALAAEIGGTEAELTALEKLHLEKAFRVTVQSLALNRDSRNLFAELKRNIARVPDRERERLRRVSQLEASRLDITHPPTAYRVQLLKSRPVLEPRVVLLSSTLEQIEHELLPAQERVQKKLVDWYVKSISR